MFNKKENKFNSYRTHIYLKDDIDKIDEDILANIQRYNIFHSLSDANCVEFNIYLSTMENWLIEQWQCNKPVDYYRKLASRFNSSYEEIISSRDLEQCILICFLEHLKKIGHNAYFDLYTEAVLHVDGYIIDSDDELMKIGSIN